MKKLLILALALIMVLSLAACGGGNDAPAPSGGSGNTPSSSEQPSSTPDDSTPSSSEQPSNTPSDSTPSSSEQQEQSGVSWSENDYTAQVPTLPESILACCTETYESKSQGTFSFYYYDTTPPIEALQEYVTELEGAGFTGNELVNTTEIDKFNYSASNAEGYRIVLTHDYFVITKPQ